MQYQHYITSWKNEELNSFIVKTQNNPTAWSYNVQDFFLDKAKELYPVALLNLVVVLLFILLPIQIGIR